MKKIAVLFIFLFSTSFLYSQVNFEKGSLSDVLQKAASEKKVLMVDVLTDWCKWCIELDNKVYSKSEISEYANANLINYKIDAEKGEGIEFAKKYNIKGYPTVLFLDGDGNEIDRIYGYFPAKEFLVMMQDYNKGVNTYNALKQTLEMDPNNIEANLKMADKLITLGEDKDAKTLLNKIIEVDPQNAGGKTDDAKYKLAALAGKETIINEIETFIKENPQSDVLKDACLSLAENYFNVNSDIDNADKCYKELLAMYPGDESIKSSYGQYLNSRAITLADKGKGEEDYKKGLSLIEEALPHLMGTVNEGSSYYIQSKLYYNLKEYNKALDAVNKALKIFDRKLYRDHKEKIEKQLSSK
ncbi:MAG: thioredoxin fold domain-containing protein [Ignavibacteria bacterium]